MKTRGEPTRLSEDETLRAVLESARDDDPGAAQVERVRARLAAAIAAGAVVAGGGSSAAASSGAAVASSVGAASVAPGLAWKAIALVGLVLGGGAIGFVSAAITDRASGAREAVAAPVLEAAEAREDAVPASSRTERRDVVPPASEHSIEVGPVVAREAVVASERVVSPRRVLREPRAVTPARSAIVASEEPESNPRAESTDALHLAEEVALIDAARRALASDPDAALALAAQHRARFPEGVLRAERERLIERALRARHVDSAEHEPGAPN